MTQINAERENREKEIIRRRQQRQAQGSHRSSLTKEDTRQAELLEDFVVSGSHFFSSCPPNVLIDVVKDYADEECFDLELSEEKFQIQYCFSQEQSEDDFKFNHQFKIEESKNESTEPNITVRVLKNTEDNYCVEFINLDCSKIEFLNHFIRMKEEVLDFANDSQFNEFEIEAQGEEEQMEVEEVKQ